MKDLPAKPNGYFERFNTNPVFIKPFDPKAKLIAKEYVELLQNLLKDYRVEIFHRGSTAFGISGKGDVEIGVYPAETDWQPVMETLRGYFGEFENSETDYARINTEKDEFEIEIILQKGETAKIDIALSNYLMSHSELLSKYEKIKQEYSYSKKEYQIQKYQFLRKVVECIPEDYSGSTLPFKDKETE